MTEQATGKKILYVDMDGVICDFQAGLDKVDPEVRQAYEGDEDKIPGLFALLEPMPGAIDAVTELSGLYDTYVLSTVPWGNLTGASDKIDWIKKHFGHEKGTPLWKRITLTHHKHLCRGDVLVDDRPNNGADKFAQANPGGEWLHFGSAEFPDWNAVLTYLRKRA